MLKQEVLDQLRKQYQKKENHQQWQTQFSEQSIWEVCMDAKTVKEQPNTFDIELPDTRIFHQGDSMQCWVYAGFKMIKGNIAEALQMDESSLYLSAAFIRFYDRLEKSNTLYQKILMEEITIDHWQEEVPFYFLSSDIGTFSSFLNVVQKYGMVPATAMPETYQSYHPSLMQQLFDDKLKGDVEKLLRRKETESKESLEEYITSLLEENYTILCLLLGEPPQQFDYHYQTKTGAIIHLEKISPLTFKKKYCLEDLNNYISIISTGEDSPYYQTYFLTPTNLQEGKNIVLNLPIQEISALAVAQLKNQTPVWFGIALSKFNNEKVGLLDMDLYQYQRYFDFTLMNRRQLLAMDHLNYDHAMALTGVKMNEQKPIRWKVENSFGSTFGKHGYFTMSQSYFERYLCLIIIHKKYLLPKQVAALEKTPIFL